MANVFGIITAIVLALAGFVAYKNKEAYKGEIAKTGNETHRKAEYDSGIKASLETKKTQFDNEKANLGYNQGRLKRAQTDFKDTKEKREGVDGENVKLGEDKFAQDKVNEGLKSQKEEKTAKINENKAKLDDIREKTSKVGDINVLASKLRGLKADIEELAQNISDHEAKLANLNNENTQAEAHIKALKDKFETISQNRSLPTLKTQIRSIYPTWGFVTLASGNDAGVVTGSTLDVIRDGSTIAKLLVTAVERNSASASIVPDSIAQDVTLTVGDRVVPSQKALTNEPATKTTVKQPAAAQN